MTRPSCVRVDLAALRSNYLYARQLHGGRALAVIKADAYGHGALAAARALASSVDGFGVAFLDEACALREDGVSQPILVLEGVFDSTELRRARELDLWLVVHQQEQIDMLAATPIPAGLDVWLKIDSGMNRAGFKCGAAANAHERLLGTGKVGSVTLMTHFACADERDKPMTARQIEAFDAATATLPGERSLCNSTGLLWWPHARRDWARPGLMLYGVAQGGEVPALQPVMSFSSTVFAVRTLEPGESIGYGATFVADRRMRAGLVCAGYADGYPQNAPTGTPVAVNGRVTRTLGHVSMDMISIDLTDLPEAGVGAEVELWGRTVALDAVARAVDRSPYELLCGAKRAPLVHTDAARLE